MTKTDEEAFDNRPLVDVVAEQMAINDGFVFGVNDKWSAHFRTQAEQLLRAFEEIMRRPAADFPEIEEFAGNYLETPAARLLSGI